MAWTKSSRTSSITDLINYPQGFMANALIGFLASNIVSYLALGMVLYIIFRLIAKSNKTYRAVQAPMELKIQTIMQNRKKRRVRNLQTTGSEAETEADTDAEQL